MWPDEATGDVSVIPHAWEIRTPRQGRGRVVCGCCMGGGVSKQLGRQSQTAASPQRQLATTGQIDGNRTASSGLQLLAGKQALTLDHDSAGAVAGHREHFAYHFSHRPNHPDHIPS